MPSTPTRRAILRSVGLALGGAVAGCVAAPGTGETHSSATTAESTTSATEPPVTGTYADRPDGPEPYPERPSSLTPESVRQYARFFEYGRAYNTLYETDAEEVRLEGHAAYDVAADGGHYALAACTGYANYEDGLHADWGQMPALYFVSENLTVRVSELDSRTRNYRDVFAADDPAENVVRPGEGRAAGYRVYDLDPRRGDLSVTVEFLGGDAPVEAFAADYDLAEFGGVTQENVTYRRGEYRVVAELGSGMRATARWRVDGPFRPYQTAAVVAPTGGLSVRRLPVDDLP